MSVVEIEIGWRLMVVLIIVTVCIAAVVKEMYE